MPDWSGEEFTLISPECLMWNTDDMNLNGDMEAILRLMRWNFEQWANGNAVSPLNMPRFLKDWRAQIEALKVKIKDGRTHGAFRQQMGSNFFLWFLVFFFSFFSLSTSKQMFCLIYFSETLCIFSSAEVKRTERFLEFLEKGGKAEGKRKWSGHLVREMWSSHNATTAVLKIGYIITRLYLSVLQDVGKL